MRLTYVFCLLLNLCLVTPFSLWADENYYTPDPKLVEYQQEITYQLNQATKYNFTQKVESYQKMLDDINKDLEEDKKQWLAKKKQSRIEQLAQKKEAYRQKRYETVYQQQMRQFKLADKQKERVKKAEEQKAKNLEKQAKRKSANDTKSQEKQAIKK